MAIFASTTTSGYSDPMKAMTIKALEKRQADMMAQNAQSGAITPENTQTPIQGVGHIVNQIAGQMNEGRAMQAVAAQRQALAQTMAGIDWEKGPTSQQVAGLGADPELMKQVLTTMAENRRAAQQDATTRYGYDKTAETAVGSQRVQERGQDVQERNAIRSDETARAGQGVQERSAIRSDETARAGQGVQKDIATEGNKLQLELQSNSTLARREERIAEQDWKSKEARAAEAAATGQTELAARLREEAAVAQRTFEDKQGATKRAFEGEQAEKQRASVKENLSTQLDATREGQIAKQNFEARQQELELAFKGGQQDKIIAAQAARDQAQQAVDVELKKLGIAADAAKPQSEPGKIKADETQGKLPEGTFASTQAPKPEAVAKTIELQTQQTQRESIVDELKQAKELLGKGINTGLLKGFDTLRGQLPGGFLGDQAQSQRTEQFDSTMKKVATTNMSTILKGASTNYEMQEFVKQYNNPRVSMEDKRRAFERVLTAAEKDANFGAAAISALPGAQKAGTPAAAGAPAAPAGDQDAAARQWLNDHPDDPRAEAVRKRLGGK